MKRLFAIVCLLALLLCACAEPEPAHVQEPISQPEDVGQAAEASEKTALLSPAAARMADLTAADIHYTDFDVDADALCAALREASACQTQYVSDAMPHYMLTVYLTETFSSAAENFFLTAGLDEPYVRITGCCAILTASSRTSTRQRSQDIGTFWKSRRRRSSSTALPMRLPPAFRATPVLRFIGL